MSLSFLPDANLLSRQSIVCHRRRRKKNIRQTYKYESIFSCMRSWKDPEQRLSSSRRKFWQKRRREEWIRGEQHQQQQDLQQNMNRNPDGRISLPFSLMGRFYDSNPFSPSLVPLSVAFMWLGCGCYYWSCDRKQNKNTERGREKE